MQSFQSPGPIVWNPPADLIAQSHLTQFMRRHGIASLEQLMHRSTTDVAWFWGAVLDELGIRFSTPYSQVLDLSRGIAWPRWCVGGTMNIVDNCLDRYAGTAQDQRQAIRWEDEAGEARTLLYGELRREVNQFAAGLRSLGLGRGDVIGVFMPMVPEIVVAMLAIVKIGAIFLPLFSGYGPDPVASRLGDAGAKGLITADGCVRRGKQTPIKAIADEAAARVPTLGHVIVLRRTGCAVSWDPGRDHWWHELNSGQRVHDTLGWPHWW